MRANRPTQDFLRRSILRLAVVAVAAPSLAGAQQDQHLQRVNEENAAFHEWVDQEARNLKTYLPKRGLPDGPNEDFDMYIDDKKPSYKTPQKTNEEIARTDATQELFEHYYGHQGPAKRRGIFIESGRTWNGEGEWNELRWAGLEVKSLRDKFLDECVKAGIFQIRFGIGMETINPNRPDSIQSLLDFHKEAWTRGIALTDSVLFFSNLREFEVKGPDGKIDFERSYYAHENFVETVEHRTDFAMTQIFMEEAKFNKANAALPKAQQKPFARTAVNKFNEPDTAVGFLLHFWNEAKGLWSHPEYIRFYIKQMMGSTRATVRIGAAVERAKKKAIAKYGLVHPMDARILYFHNEAMTPKRYPTHQGDLQFVISQFILGDESLMTADYDRLMKEPVEEIKARFEAEKAAGTINPVDAVISRFSHTDGVIAAGRVEQARTEAVTLLKQLRDEHIRFQRETGKTAKTDTMLMLDYYQQSEFILPKSVPEIIKDLAAEHGKKLIKAIGAKTEQGFMNLLRERVEQAEAVTGVKIWNGETRISEIDFQRLLSVEDGIVLDKLIGLRNEITLDTDLETKARRERAGFNAEELNAPGNDEHRIDKFLNTLLRDQGKLLKHALDVTTDVELVGTLNLLANKSGLAVEYRAGQSIRDLLNANERAFLYKIFGMHRERFLGFLPPHYARQIRAGLRDGVVRVMVPHVLKFKVYNVGFAELGGPYVPWAMTNLKQSTVGLSAVARETGSYITSIHVGPAIGVPGWQGGPLTGTIATNKNRGQDGIFKLVRYSPKNFGYELNSFMDAPPFYADYARDLDQGLQRAQERVLAKNPHAKGAFAERAKGAFAERAKPAINVDAKANMKPLRVIRTCEGLF